MLDVFASDVSPAVKVARSKVFEGARRFALPFGIEGKKVSYRKALESHRFCENPTLIIQDVRLIYPPEYIFGLEMGDCLSIQTMLDASHESLLASVELMLIQYRPTFGVVAASTSTHDKDMLEAGIRNILCGSKDLKRRIREGSLVLDGCLVDESNRQTFFFPCIA